MFDINAAEKAVHAPQSDINVKVNDIVILRNDEPFMDKNTVGYAYLVTEVHPETNFIVSGNMHVPMSMIVMVIPDLNDIVKRLQTLAEITHKSDSFDPSSALTEIANQLTFISAPGKKKE